jgi:hypothetical protein
VPRDFELEGLEDLYRTAAPTSRLTIPDSVTTNIRSTAKDQISGRDQRSGLPLYASIKSRSIWSGLSFAAGIALAVFMGDLGKFSSLDQRMAGDQKVVAEGDDLVSPLATDTIIDKTMLNSMEARDASYDFGLIGNSEPEKWQRKIAEQALLGNMEFVENLAVEFNKRFPDYGDIKERAQ